MIPKPQKLIHRLLYFGGAIALSWTAVACQPAQAPLIPTTTRVPATPIQALLQSRMPLPTPETSVSQNNSAQVPTDPTESPNLQPSPTPLPAPTLTPTPPPEPTFYTIQPGDTLIGIAEQFNISPEGLVFANGYTSLAELRLVVGEELQIPACQAHRIVSGNTLASVAQLCGITLDELIITNISRLASLGSLENVPLNFILYIPSTTSNETLNCDAQPIREQVIEYRPQPTEGPFCMGQKFGVSTTAIIQGNQDRLTSDTPYGETSLLIPPRDGALYVITTEDIQNGVTIADLAEWYEVEPQAITDWNINPISDPLLAGQQLFIDGANLIFGIFTSQAADSDETG